ncbi:hypothetical protein FJ938_26520 [Mesorhizobium sp. B2-4-14]|uniref:hypothetical protein n=1 Tax=Mesorhizobium sp. B2-4-14 TaxID=2589935 RepID=UPI00112E6ACE|nr:hypothetical protein [Mesorhizobium sp. B2-4-14]TPK97345.1 hypothetical protein FJ938_26520 [Mesorhizobium sp. B2-4-14]
MPNLATQAPALEAKAPNPQSRQVRRSAEREAAKAANATVKDAARIEAEVRAMLGYLPDAAEVAGIIKDALSEELLALDAIRMKETAAGLLAGAVPAAVGYIAFLGAIRRGPACERALATLDPRYGPEAVLELRAVTPDGGALSRNARLGHERDQLAAHIIQHTGLRNIYHGINSRRAELAGSTAAANASDVAERRYVVLDLDNKDAPGVDPNWTRTVAALAPYAALIVYSGNGMHIWFSIEPVQGADVIATTVLLADAMAAIGADNMADAARPIRLPYTINIPNKAKRARGAMLALARIWQGYNPNAPRRSVMELAQHLHDTAQRLGLPGRKKGTRVNVTMTAAGATPLPPELRRVAALKLLEAALSLLPNNVGMDRDLMVRLFHAVKGAADGTGFEAEARDAALAWAARWFGSDPDHDARTYDGIRDARFAGWPHIRDMLREHNPAGFAQIEAMEAPYRAEAARAAFAGADAERQLREQGIDPDCVANDNTMPQFSASAAGSDAAASTSPAKAGKKNRAEAAIEHLTNVLHADFFNSPDGKLWLQVLGLVFQVSEKGSNRAIHSLLVKRGHVLTGSAKDELRDIMAARAMAGPTHEVFYRQTEIMSAGKPVAVVLNLMDADANGVHITAAGWSVRPLSAIVGVRMTTRPGSLPLPRPVRAGDGVGFFDRLRRHIPLASVQRRDDPLDAGIQQEAIVLMFLLAQVLRPGAVAHLLLSGGQGSGKTTVGRRVKDITDPDTAAVVTSLPDNEPDVYAVVGSQTCIVVDNASGLKAPDLIAALATGTAYAKRELYTDSGRMVLVAKASLIFTTVLDGITQRADVRDRMLRLELPRIDPRKRRIEAHLDAAWEADRAHLLADLLDLAVGALARLDAVKVASDAGLLPPLPRLADAALIAEAAAQAAGWKPGVLLAAINDMRSTDAERQLEDNAYAARVRALLEQAPGGTWTGTPQALVNALRFMDGPDWGRQGSDARAVMSMAQRIEPLMRDAWDIETIKQRTKHARTITLRVARAMDQAA